MVRAGQSPAAPHANCLAPSEPAGGCELSGPRFAAGVLLVALAAATLLFWDLGGPGLWEPGELAAAEKAAAFDGWLPSDGALAGVALRVFGGREGTARLPFAASAFLATFAVLWAGARLGGRRAGLYAAAVLLFTPLLLYQGRQLLSHAPALLAAGLVFGAFGPWAAGRREASNPLVLALGALGLAIGSLCAGLLIGLGLPALVIGGTALLDAGPRLQPAGTEEGEPERQSDRTDGRFRRRTAVAVLVFGVLLTLLGLVRSHPAGGLSWWLGAAPVLVPEAEQTTFVALLERLGWGLFPFAPFLILALASPFANPSPPDAELRGSAPGRAVPVLLLLGTVLSLLVSAIVAHVSRQPNLVALVPAALAIGQWFVANESVPAHRPSWALVGGVFALLLLRDLRLEPEALVSAHLIAPIVWPEGLATPAFALVLGGVAAAAVPILTLDPFGPAHRRLHRLWDRLRRATPAGLLLVGMAGAFAHAHHLLPTLSRQLSAKETLDVFRQRAPANTPLLLFEIARSGAGFEDLSFQPAGSLEQLVRALGQPPTAFALIPRARLAAVDRALAQGKVAYCVPASGSRAHLLLATGTSCTSAAPSPLSDLRWRPSDPWPRPGWASASASALATFGEAFELIAAEFPRRVERGDNLSLTLVFRVIGTPSPNQDVFVHLQPASGTIVNGDHQPAGGVFPTAAWRAGDFVRDQHAIALPRMTTRAGTYHLFFGFWPGGDTDVRVPVTHGRNDGHNRVPLGQVEVQ